MPISIAISKQIGNTAPPAAGHTSPGARPAVARRDANARAARGDVGAVHDRVAEDLIAVAAVDEDAIRPGLIDHVVADDVVVGGLVRLRGDRRRLRDPDAVVAHVLDHAAGDPVGA